MSITEVHAASWNTIALWTVKVALAAVFFAAGGAKVYGEPGMVETFEAIGLGQWFRYVTGALEVTGAFLIYTGTVWPKRAPFVLHHGRRNAGAPVRAAGLIRTGDRIVYAQRHGGLRGTPPAACLVRRGKPIRRSGTADKSPDRSQTYAVRQGGIRMSRTESGVGRAPRSCFG